MSHRILREHDERHDKPEQNRQGGQHCCDCPLPPLKILEGDRAITARGMMRARSRTRLAFDSEQCSDEHQHDGGKLGRATKV